MKIEFEVCCTDADAIKEFDSELNSINDIEVEKIKQNGFDGMDILFYFIATGGSIALIKSIAQVAIKFIKRDDVKSFKAHDIEIKGYSAKEVEDLLKQIDAMDQ